MGVLGARGRRRGDVDRYGIVGAPGTARVVGRPDGIPTPYRPVAYLSAPLVTS